MAEQGTYWVRAWPSPPAGLENLQCGREDWHKTSRRCCRSPGKEGIKVPGRRRRWGARHCWHCRCTSPIIVDVRNSESLDSTRSGGPPGTRRAWRGREISARRLRRLADLVVVDGPECHTVLAMRTRKAVLIDGRFVKEQPGQMTSQRSSKSDADRRSTAKSEGPGKGRVGDEDTETTSIARHGSQRFPAVLNNGPTRVRPRLGAGSGFAQRGSTDERARAAVERSTPFALSLSG